MSFRPLLLCAVMVILANDSFAALSKEQRDWGSSAVQFLMTKPERAAWASISDEADARDFIEAFWARRDPTPGTPANEFRQQIESRSREADKRFAARHAAGSLTDRGMVLVLFGEPDRIELNPPGATPAPNGGLSGAMGQFNRRVNSELWIYKGEKAAGLGFKAGDSGLLFSDEISAGEIQLAPGSRRAMEAAAVVIARAAFEKGRGNALADDKEVVALRLILVGDAATAEAIVRQAQAGADFAELARKHSAHPSAPLGGYIGKISRGELAPDFRSALAGVAPGGVLLIKRSPSQYAVVKLLTAEETAHAEQGVK